MSFYHRTKVAIARRAISSFPRGMALYRHYRHLRLLSRPARDTVQGFKFSGNDAMISGQFEPVETLLITRLISATDVVVNIGANVGYYCCLARKMDRHVVAFEPMPANVDFLCRNLRENSWEDEAEVFPLALADKPGVLEIFGGGTGASLIPGWSGVPKAYKMLIPVSTVDLVLGERFKDERVLVIMDVEGAELSVLSGGADLLNRRIKPIWFIEVAINENQPQGVRVNPNLVATFQLFADLGYVSLTADVAPREITLAEVCRIAETAVDTIGTHNFVFVEKQSAPRLLRELQSTGAAAKSGA